MLKYKKHWAPGTNVDNSEAVKGQDYISLEDELALPWVGRWFMTPHPETVSPPVIWNTDAFHVEFLSRLHGLFR